MPKNVRREAEKTLSSILIEKGEEKKERKDLLAAQGHQGMPREGHSNNLTAGLRSFRRIGLLQRQTQEGVVESVDRGGARPGGSHTRVQSIQPDDECQLGQDERRGCREGESQRDGNVSVLHQSGRTPDPQREALPARTT